MKIKKERKNNHKISMTNVLKTDSVEEANKSKESTDSVSKTANSIIDA